MKRKFILIDHSILNASGHHLEYAKRVLQAAKAQGFTTVLGVNKAAQTLTCPAIDSIIPIFTRHFWQNERLSVGAALRILFPGIFINKNYSAQFCAELATLLQSVEATETDILFAPTIGATELRGLALFSQSKAVILPVLHLLLRRDLDISASILQLSACLRRIQINRALWEFKNDFSGPVYFYTDTEQLSTQYNQLDIFKFATLPIPIGDVSLRKKPYDGAGPLTISYLGDAREEKGFHLIPQLINKMRADGFDAKKIRFCVQIDASPPYLSRKLSSAREALIHLADEGLDLIEGPFGSEKYNDVLAASDVILLPYQATSYKNRSSGIFVEALAAGIPTIYPRGSWMEKARDLGGSVGFDKAEEIPSALKKIYSDYEKYECQSSQLAALWRQKHCASHLVSLIERQ